MKYKFSLEGASKSPKSLVELPLEAHFPPDQLCLRHTDARPSWLEGISKRYCEESQLNLQRETNKAQLCFLSVSFIL